MNEQRYGVLFVCLGNICRSPMAKFVMQHEIERRGLSDRFEVDSCGTGHWHVGGPADHRTVSVAAGHGLRTEHVARVVDPVADAARFDVLVAMDRMNVETLVRRGVPEGKIVLMREYDPESQGGEDVDVPDPYEGTMTDFERVYRMLVRSCGVMVERVVSERGWG